LLSLSLLALGACGTGTVNYVQIDESYDPVQYRQLPFTGPIYTEVSGNPFAIAQPDLNLIVNAAVQPNGVPVSDGLGPRVHIAFGKTATDIHDACTAAGTLGQAGGKIAMTAALCRGTNTAMTYLVASTDSVADPHDPKFKAFLKQTVAQLFPAQNPNLQNNGQCILPGC
jgi:hypothetical protein